MESAPNLPGAGAVSQQGSKQQQLSFAAEQLSAAELHLVALQRLYQQEAELSVQPLRHPRMMQLLLSGASYPRSGVSNTRPLCRTMCAQMVVGCAVLFMCCFLLT
jgi:hypothetical protein